MEITVHVMNTGTLEVDPVGSVILYQDEAIEAVGELDTDGNVSFTTDTTILGGTHQFSACYRGDTNFLPVNSDTITIEITGGPVAVKVPRELNIQAYISEGYLHIFNITPGSAIRLYNSLGQCLIVREAHSDHEIIDVNGFFVMVVSYEDKIFIKRFFSKE